MAFSAAALVAAATATATATATASMAVLQEQQQQQQMMNMNNQYGQVRMTHVSNVNVFILKEHYIPLKGNITISIA